MRYVVDFFATGCFAGRIPLMPGTWGTVVGVGLYWLVRYLPLPAYLAFVAAFTVFSIWVATQAQKLYDETDPPQVVIDEIAGFLVTMAFHKPSLALVVTGFVLFRLYDIVKPWPLKWMERRFADGRGVVLDDILAGVYANITLFFFEIVLPALGIKGIDW